MTTVVAQIGNSDDKLGQAKWAQFVQQFHNTMGVQTTLHFFGYSDPAAHWQNACAVGLIAVDDVVQLQRRLAALVKRFDQDSIAFTIGGTEFITTAYLSEYLS